jgi:murein DD-endopeptidase MepM/ murein hydrolase activator NlpD
VASDQLAYAPVRPEGDTAQERDDFRLPRQRSTMARTAAAPAAPAPMPVTVPGMPGPAVMAGPGAAGLAVAPAGQPETPLTLPDAGSGASLAGVPTYDPSAVAAARAEPVAAAEFTTAGAPTPVREVRPAETPADPGAALCARIVGQATAQREEAARAEREVVERAAAQKAAREAAERKVREQAAAAKAAAEEKARAEAAAAAQAEAERLIRLAASYIKPVTSCTLGAGFGEADPWANLHTGQDFAAPTGTPVHAVHGGTVISAGWAGSYGYRVVLALEDGTELSYCHLSTMVVTEGQVTTGDTVGRVGATGNVPAPHLHLEVRPGGGAPVDPLPWLRGHDVAV